MQIRRLFRRAARITTTIVVLSAADIRILKANPLTLIDDPGAGRLVVPVTLQLVYAPGAVPYHDDVVRVHVVGSLTDLWVPSVVLSALSPEFRFAVIGKEDGVDLVAGSATSHPLQIHAALQLTRDTEEPQAGALFGSDVTLGAGGAGYAANDTFTINGGSTPLVGTVQTVVVGVVTAFTLGVDGTGFGGGGYAAGAGRATTATSGTGTGLTVDIAATATTPYVQGDGTLRLTLESRLVDVP